MNRRDFIEQSLIAGMGVLTLPNSGCKLTQRQNQAKTKYLKKIISSNHVSYVKGKDIAHITETAVNLLAEKIAMENGIKNKKGMAVFVNRTDKVIIKPNIGWARLPELAATTNPDVIKTIIELCYNAGASEVKVSDLPCNSAHLSFERTGILNAAKSVDGIVTYPKSHRVKVMKLEQPIYLPLSKKEIKSWPVFIDFIEADVVINIPIAKQHNLSKLTLGMKNWYGAIAGKRNQLHQAIHESIASLAWHFKPTLTIIDAVKILIKNGPTGGSIHDTKETNTIIASQSQVAADAVATTLFNLKPEDIPYIKIAHSMGMGDYELSKLNILKQNFLD